MQEMNMPFHKQILILVFSVLFLSGFAQSDNPDTELFLFTDREFCVSGDTVWFNVFLKNGQSKSNVVHVQLTSAGNHIIGTVMKKSSDNRAEGYIQVPDSLSSGVYFLSAFFYQHLSEEEREVEKKSLFVYNRFQPDLTELFIPAPESKLKEKGIVPKLQVKPGKSKYKVRENVSVELSLGNINPSEIKEVIVKASLVDDLARQGGGRFLTSSAASPMVVPGFEEKDGFILGGKVTQTDSNESPEKAVVFLSLPENPSFLDYYVTGDDGYFYFFLENAVGVGEVVLQAISENGTELKANVEFSMQKIQQPVILQKQTLNQQQIDFMNVLTGAGFIKRLFQENYTIPPIEFSMSNGFSIPVYGHPQRTVDPDEFYELNNFREISRELLPGLQYRTKRGSTTIRMLNLNENAYFETEPFKLINGVPVFKNRLFASLGSSDIDQIEYAMEDRLFGDLRFTGILALYLKDNSNRWMANQPDFKQFSVPLLQPEKKSEIRLNPELKENIPDLRTVYLWQIMKTGEDQKIDFFLSDIKGKVEIAVEGVTQNGQIFKHSEIIEVK
jgi:hypothetical protein